MAHFAKIGINGKVIQVITFDDKRMQNADGIEDEEVGRQILENETGWPLWVQCSFNTHAGKHLNDKTAFRATYPKIGDFYDQENEIFYQKRPVGCESWTLNLNTGQFDPPTPMPAYEDSTYEKDGTTYKYQIQWDESSKKWEGYSDDGLTKLATWNGASWVKI